MKTKKSNAVAPHATHDALCQDITSQQLQTILSSLGSKVSSNDMITCSTRCTTFNTEQIISIFSKKNPISIVIFTSQLNKEEGAV